ncbi:MAG: hypothetical protein PHT59_07450 [Candidatus Omnitrophica bacterium]|nr:hypothetical protein [Candidatus Omnitrophota bacterium]
MPAYPIITNFTSGEASPRLDGRVDVSKYYNSCRTLQNMIVHPHGGASRRFGTVYVAETKDSSKKSRLIPFQYSITQAYILELGDFYMRFFRNNGQIVSGTAAYEIGSPYSEDNLAAIKYAQNADTMRIANQSVSPQELTRSGHTAWTLTTSTFTSSPSLPWSEGNYPGAVSFYEERCVYAGTPSSPQSMWLSATGAYNDMVSGAADDDYMNLTLAADQVNVIRWMTPGRYLNVGTVEGEWVVSSGSDDAAMTPTQRKARRVTNYGSADIQALPIGNAILFLQRAGRKVRELAYQYVQDNYAAPDLTLIAEHITSGGIKEWAFQKEPDAILWCVRNDGKLLGLTYNKEQEVVAWHIHETDGEFESVAVIPVSGYDQVWFIVNRTVDGSTKRYVEYMAPDFGDDQDACWFVDCGLAYSGTAATELSGLDHLEGKFVSILADGAVSPDRTVLSGSITIPYAAASVTVGLKFKSILEPMRLEIQGAQGTSQGRIKKIHQLAVRFYKTLGAKIGSASGTLDTISFRTPSDLMGQPPALFTGDKVIPFPGGWDRNGFIRIEQEQPLPMTVLSIMPTVSTE